MLNILKFVVAVYVTCMHAVDHIVDTFSRILRRRRRREIHDSVNVRFFFDPLLFNFDFICVRSAAALKSENKSTTISYKCLHFC